MTDRFGVNNPASGRSSDAETGMPLAGVRVVEFGNLVAAPYCGMLLADLGAEVVKVEPPDGDLARAVGPFQGGESQLFMALNRGKRSVVLDLGREEDRRWALALCARARVVVHNLRSGAMERAGLGYSQVAALNPDVAYVSISAFGAEGPHSERAGVDVIVQGESGMMSLTGRPGDPPLKTATTIGDFVAGTNAAMAACAGLARGKGGRYDVSLRDGLIAVQAGWNALHFTTGAQPERTGTASPFLAPNQAFPTSDGWMTLAIVSDRHYRLLCDLLGLPVDFETNEDRMAHLDVVNSRLSEEFRRDRAESWVAKLTAAGLPAGRVLTLPEVFADPQVRHNRMAVEMDHATAGRITVTGSPVRVDGRAAPNELPPPTLGAHTAQVLAELGVSI